MLDGLRAAGLKLTAPRVAIVDALAEDVTHPTAQILFERVRERVPGVSFATVYNALGALNGAGLCASLTVDRGSARFDPNLAPHHHAVCDRCGAVRDVPAKPRDSTRDVQAASKVAPGFAVRAVERVLRGTCERCTGRASSRRARRKAA